MPLPLAAVLQLLFVKKEGDALEESLDEMYRHFRHYRLELAYEEIRRKTAIEAELATVESIFTPPRIHVLLNVGG